MASVTANQEREMRVALERVVGFAHEFGELHLKLACHAAFPLVITPDLLYQIWANFLPEAPWTAVARVLLSRLCKQVGYEMYEMDITVRNLLLRELKELFGQERLEDLAEFLLEYVKQRLTDDNLDTQDLREAQEWTALAYTKPTEAARQLAEKLRSRVTQENITELFRLTSLVQTFAEPLTEAGFEPLLAYSRGVESFVRGNLEDAAEKLGEILQDNAVEVAGVTLPIPEKVKGLLREDIQEPINDEDITPSTQLAKGNLYIIAIGGTGAKCVEAITQVAALGLFSEDLIRVLFIDADETNGNLERSRNSLSLYQRCFQLMSGDKQQLVWLKTPIESFDLWSPFGNRSTNKNLASFFNYNTLKQNNEALGNLFDVLYTKDEREADLDVGFRGRPAIGSAVMSRVDLDDLDQEPWGNLIEQIKADAGSGKSPKILLCGSMFGGTGASGLPTIGRLIANKLDKENVRGRVKIGCLFVLPYFGFSPKPGNNTDKVYARADQFLLNTEAALRYYVNQAKQFDTVYLLGNQNFSQYEFSIGKKTQRNEPHFIELYGALAARHFWLNTPAKAGTVVLISRQNKSKLLWNDLPDQDAIKSSLVNATRFAYVWLGDIVPELEKARDMGVNKFQKAAPWFTKFFRSHQDAIIALIAPRGENLPDFNDSREQDAMRVITDWCQDYLRWVNDIHKCDGDNIELFRYLALDKLDGQLRTEELSELVVGDDRDRSSKVQDTGQKLKERLDPRNLTPPNQGTAGLAKALYILCRLS